MGVKREGILVVAMIYFSLISLSPNTVSLDVELGLER